MTEKSITLIYLFFFLMRKGLAYCPKEHFQDRMSRTMARSDGDRPRQDHVPRRDDFGQVSFL